MLPTPTPAPVLAPMSSDESIVLPSLLLESVTARRADLFTLPAGVYGFESCRTYALVPSGREKLWWLQSADRAELVFLVADPFHYFPGYEADVPPVELAQVGVSSDATLMVLVIVTLPQRDGEGPTANLRAPLVLDVDGRVGRQVVLADERYGVQTPFALS